MTYIGERGSRWKGREVLYKAAHDRVKSKYGPASTHGCAHCDKPAAEWAYDHTDADPLIDPRGYEYSTDPDKYTPLCRLCHHVFDGRSLDPCGTINAYQRHLRRGEPTCAACKAASAAYEAARKARKQVRDAS